MRIRVLRLAALTSALLTTGLVAGPSTARAQGQGPATSVLHLRSARLVQQGTELHLDIRTRESWRSGALGGDSLCVVLPSTQLCFAANPRRRLVAIANAKTIPAHLEHPNAHTLSARILPYTLRLRFGSLHWSVRTRWHDEASCAAGCEDQLPRTGTSTTRVSAYGAPRCYGAAARARATPCVNPALQRSATPAPSTALLLPDGDCQPITSRFSVIAPCAFGYLDDHKPATIALVGDSHTAHLRAAIDVAAQARGRRVISITRPGCAFSTEAYPAPPPIPQRCLRHSAEAISWLDSHPRVRTVITSASAGRGLSVAGFAAQLHRVPATVTHIYVIRDVPRVSYATGACVSQVRRRHDRSDHACTIPRGAAILSDPLAAAASSDPRARVIDLDHFFCDSSRCYPVIGGVYAYKDANHLNRVFAATLGPFLLGMIGHT